MRGIYKIYNTLTGKCYIGQSINVPRRWTEHIYHAKHFNKEKEKNKLYLALNKYGLDNFEFSLIENCPSEISLDEREIYWISYYNSFVDGYNSTKGGQGSCAQKIEKEWIYQLWDDGLSSKEIQYITNYSKTSVYQYLKHYKNYSAQESKNRGYKSNLDILKNIEQNIPYQMIDKHWNKLCQPIYQYDLFGNYIQMFHSIAEAERYFNTSIGDSSIRKYLNNRGDNTALGYQWSKEKVEKMPIVARPRAKLVKCITTLEIFPSAKDASEKYNIPRQSITNCCNNQLTHAGYHPITNEPMCWEYV